jgi:hypothetical protein
MSELHALRWGGLQLVEMDVTNTMTLTSAERQHFGYCPSFQIIGLGFQNGDIMSKSRTPAMSVVASVK